MKKIYVATVCYEKETENIQTKNKFMIDYNNMKVFKRREMAHAWVWGMKKTHDLKWFDVKKKKLIF